MSSRAHMQRGGLFLLLILSFGCQLMMQTYAKNFWGPHTSTIVWFVSGLIFSISAFFLGRSMPIKSESTSPNHFYSRNLLLVIGLAFFAVSIHFSIHHLDFIFKKYPVMLDGSDIIPTIEIMVKRFIAGEPVYDLIKYDTHTTVPTYMPLTWLPYVPAEMFGWDYRWTPVYSFMAIGLAMILTSWRRSQNDSFWLLLCLAISFVFYGLMRFDNNNIRFGVELMPSVFYLILCLTLLSKRYMIVALGIVLCILSRYSFALWLPAYVIILWHHRGFAFTLKMGLSVLVGLLLFYIIPFIGLEFHKITAGLKFYNSNAESKWVQFDWQPDGAIPFHLKEGYGMAIHFYEVFKEQIEQGISVIKRFQLISISLVSLFTLAYYFLAKKTDIKFLLITSLHLYLLLFYSFLYAPYGYLFFIPLSFGIGIFWWLTVRPDHLESTN